MTDTPLQRGDVLLIVDVQIDFCPGGRLPVPEADEVVAVLNGWIRQARDSAIPIIASRDWHPQRHVSFESEGGRWPEHCVQDSEARGSIPISSYPKTS